MLAEFASVGDAVRWGSSNNSGKGIRTYRKAAGWSFVWGSTLGMHGTASDPIKKKLVEVAFKEKWERGKIYGG